MALSKHNPGCDCCGCCRVLLWDTNSSVLLGGLSEAQDVYQANNITADLSSEYSGSLDDYCLIIWLMAESDPSWWASISGATWTGRFHISAENGQGTFNDNTRNYVNSKSGLHGCTVADDFSTGACGTEDGTPSVHALTDGITGLSHAGTASVSGGTTLFTNTSLSLPFIQRTFSSGIEWVVSGESSHIADHCTGEAAVNEQWLLNLACKPMPTS